MDFPIEDENKRIEQDAKERIEKLFQSRGFDVPKIHKIISFTFEPYYIQANLCEKTVEIFDREQNINCPDTFETLDDLMGFLETWIQDMKNNKAHIQLIEQKNKDPWNAMARLTAIIENIY